MTGGLKYIFRAKQKNITYPCRARMLMKGIPRTLKDFCPQIAQIFADYFFGFFICVHLRIDSFFSDRRKNITYPCRAQSPASRTESKTLRSFWIPACAGMTRLPGTGTSWKGGFNRPLFLKRGWGDLPFCFSQVLPPVQFARVIMTQPPGGGSKIIPPVKGGQGGYAKHSLKRSQTGFTIIEILVAIVVIGITVPAIMIPFSGLGDTKNPEYVIQGSFIGQKKMEELASKFRDTITATCPEGTAATSTDGDYSLDCVSEQVNATDPDTSTTSTFARKVTLTVSRTDGAMSPLVFNSLFALDS